MYLSPPEQRAEQLLKEYGINSVSDLDLEELANSEYLIIEEEDLSNHLGRISFGSEYGLIKIDSKIKEPGQKRFTLGHEMGHYFNEKLKIQPACRTGMNEKLKDLRHCKETALTLVSSEGREGDANKFAAELLMHKPWFSNYIRNREINFELIKDIAGYFKVSLMAAAIRYSEIGKYPAAVILSREGKKVWSSINDYFPFKWIPKGYSIKKESAAYDFFNLTPPIQSFRRAGPNPSPYKSLGKDLTPNPSPYKSEGKDLTPNPSLYKGEGKEMQTCADLIPAYAWFAEDNRCRKDVYLYEQNVAMPKYNAVLTLLWESEFR